VVTPSASATTTIWRTDNSVWNSDLWSDSTPSRTLSWASYGTVASDFPPPLVTVTSSSTATTDWVCVNPYRHFDTDSTSGTLTAGSWWYTEAEGPTPVLGYHWVIHHNGQPSKADRFRARLRSQMEPDRRSRSDPNQFGNVAQNEIVALQLLKSMVSADRWRKYLKCGFVDVVGRSGLVYQITRGKSHVRVFRRGERLAELCVVLKNRHVMPPTDEVITRMLIAEGDESDLWRRANVYGLKLPQPQTEEDLARIVLAA